MVVEEIAGLIAQHFVPDLPVQVLSGGASNSFAIHAENSASLVLFQLSRTCQMLPAGIRNSGFLPLTAISRVTGLQSAAVPLENVARQVPAAGAAISANQA